MVLFLLVTLFSLSPFVIAMENEQSVASKVSIHLNKNTVANYIEHTFSYSQYEGNDIYEGNGILLDTDPEVFKNNKDIPYDEIKGSVLKGAWYMLGGGGQNARILQSNKVLLPRRWVDQHEKNRHISLYFVIDEKLQNKVNSGSSQYYWVGGTLIGIAAILAFLGFKRYYQRK